ncbi:hypothetical protein D9M70_574470 [compost metagenome]
MIPELMVHVGFNFPDGFNQLLCFFPRDSAFVGCQLNFFDLGFPVFEALAIKLEPFNHEFGDDAHQLVVLKAELNRGSDLLSDVFPLRMIISQLIKFSRTQYAVIRDADPRNTCMQKHLPGQLRAVGCGFHWLFGRQDFVGLRQIERTCLVNTIEVFRTKLLTPNYPPIRFHIAQDI